MDLSSQLQGTVKGFFPGVLGITFTYADKESIRAEIEVREELCTTPGVLHGGAIMAFADTLGAYGTFLNLPDGARTTTIESKTNFFAAGRTGTTITGESTPLHRGRTTMVWQTRISGPDERLVALVTQSQIVLPKELGAEEQLGSLFDDKSPGEQQALLARLERAGAGLYRTWAAAETNAKRRAILLEAAQREELNAAVLETD
jgi:1,4-dihydroxy-2-naphthoyl-CoA hydrolase